MEMIGKLIDIGPVRHLTGSLINRNFGIEYLGEAGPQRAYFQLYQYRCNLLDRFRLGDLVHVRYFIRGNRWTGEEGVPKYYNNLVALDLEEVLLDLNRGLGRSLNIIVTSQQ